MSTAAQVVELETRAQKVDRYRRHHAIELLFNSLVDDPEAIFTAAELLGVDDTAAIYQLTAATSLALELWPSNDVDDHEPAERLEAEDKAHALASVMFSRLAANADLLEDHAARHAEIAARQPLRVA